MQFITVLNQAAVLFILIIVGFILQKLKIITDEMGKGLTNLVIYATMPALIITSMNYEFSKEMFDNSILIALYGSGVFGLMILASIVFAKFSNIKEPQKGVYQFLVVFPNTGFMGYPILYSVFGQIGIFYGAIFNLIFNVLLWTLGVIFVSQNDEKKINPKKLINPGIVSVLIGFILFVLSIDLPFVIYSSLKSIGNTTTPLAMMIVGSLLGDAKLEEMLRNGRLFIISAIRLLIIPGILLLILPFFSLPNIVNSTLIILSGMPSGANAALFSRKYNSDFKLASQGVFLTTLLSIGTIPFIIFFIAKLY